MTDHNHRARQLMAMDHDFDDETRWAFHDSLARDSDFYPKLAIWSANGNNKQHLPYFVACLALAADPLARDTAAKLLPCLDPNKVATAIQLIKRQKSNVPRIIRTSVKNYLRRLENAPETYDITLLCYRNSLKTLYAGFHLRPDSRTDAILFKNQLPAGSLAAALVELSHITEPQQQAQFMQRHPCPLKLLKTAIRDITKPVAQMLIRQMTPAQLANNIEDLSAMGALTDPEVLQEVRAILDAQTIANTNIQQLERSTALLIDGNHIRETQAIVGQRFATLIQGHNTSVFWCDQKCHRITPADRGLAAWAEAFAQIPGPRSKKSGASLPEDLEQMVLIHGNRPATPLIRDIFRICAVMPVQPRITLVPIGHNRYDAIPEAFVLPAQVFEFKGDYDALHKLAASLVGPSNKTILERIEQIDFSPETFPPLFDGQNPYLSVHAGKDDVSFRQ